MNETKEVFENDVSLNVRKVVVVVVWFNVVPSSKTTNGGRDFRRVAAASEKRGRDCILHIFTFFYTLLRIFINFYSGVRSLATQQ